MCMQKSTSSSPRDSLISQHFLPKRRCVQKQLVRVNALDAARVNFRPYFVKRTTQRAFPAPGPSKYLLLPLFRHTPSDLQVGHEKMSAKRRQNGTRGTNIHWRLCG
ncbi:unnamed protein product [Cercospora beticola]|nr:unnamed protein product [Cercospora beticola]